MIKKIVTISLFGLLGFIFMGCNEDGGKIVSENIDICKDIGCSACGNIPEGGTVIYPKPPKGASECCVCEYICLDSNQVIDETEWKCVDKVAANICEGIICSPCREVPEGGKMKDVTPTKESECCACNYECIDSNQVIDETEWKCVDKVSTNICEGINCEPCRPEPEGGKIKYLEPTKESECCACNYECLDSNQVIDETEWKCVDDG